MAAWQPLIRRRKERAIPEEPESHTICLLQEMRQKMREPRGEMTTVRTDLSERLDDLCNRVDGNTRILNMIAGLVANHEDRIRRSKLRGPDCR